MAQVDSVFRMRSLGVGASGLSDQYADGQAARVWQIYIGDKEKRTSQYKQWLINQLHEHNCKTVLDVACGTGVDSVMLIEEGFSVTSCDASDKMLKHALKERWNRRKEAPFDSWVIEEANWVTLPEDLEDVPEIERGWDAVICLGNSFAHLPDFEGDQSIHKKALSNFAQLVKPGGILLIDHRNYDAILSQGSVPARNIYYDSALHVDIKVSNLYVNGRATLITLDYYMDLNVEKNEINGESDSAVTKKTKFDGTKQTHHFRLSYYPHKVKDFTSLLTEAFSGACKHYVFGDFKPVRENDQPAYFIHVVNKHSIA